jgi:tetratricopeptide (TPR) repeat protein
MAEESERKGTGPGPGRAGVDPAAISLAFGSTVQNDSVATKAEEFLDWQSRLSEEQIRLSRKHAAIADLQIEDLKREDQLRHWSLIVHHLSDVMKVTFELAIAIITLGIIFAIGATLWSAAQDHDLVIEAFSVPPDMATRGLTGEAVAAQLQDKLAAMQGLTGSGRPAESYSNNWGKDIKVQIPNTGVSIGEFYRYLASWLGNETHITGEVYRTGSGIAITARASGNGSGSTVTGAETDFNKLLQQTAEAIYFRTQPYRYAVYLQAGNPPRLAQSRAILESLTSDSSAHERAWAHVGLGSLDDNSDPPSGPIEMRLAAALVPNFALPYENLSGEEGNLGHDEASLAYNRIVIALLRSDDADLSARARAISLPYEEGNLAFALGDFASSLPSFRDAAVLPDYSGLVEASRESVALALALLHDRAASQAAFRELPATDDRGVIAFRGVTKLQAEYWLGEWPLLIAERQNIESAVRAVTAAPGYTDGFVTVTLTRQIWPYAATALAMTGDVKGAHALIDRTPLDCYTCMRNRADIDAAERKWGGADYWFARAIRAAPSIPIACSDRGRVLLEKGDADAAIAQFEQAHVKGPHFADPLEMWGEALMSQNRSDLALAKFEEADKYAPNWGRLHLEWGEALFWMGDKEGARKQFAIAAGLGLSTSDNAALSRWMASRD